MQMHKFIWVQKMAMLLVFLIIIVFSLTILNHYLLSFVNTFKMIEWFKKKFSSKEEQQIDEEELKKKGFNPEGLQVEEFKETALQDIDTDYDGFITPTSEEAAILINDIKQFSNTEEHRHQLAYSKGGKICGDKNQVNKIRSVGKEMIKLIGKKLITGDLNLTRISFPIKAMVPKTALQNSTVSCCMNPYFMKRACETKDALERFKLVITNTVSSFYYMCMFMKPLNPILGQTLQGSYPDGTQIYCQQISHHPPVSFFLAVGPDNSYRYYGCYDFSAHAGLNSISLVNKGFKTYEFPNGDQIYVSCSKDKYSGVFLGTLRTELAGSIIFEDKKSDLKAQIRFDKVKKKPTDYFESAIYSNGKPICYFDGTYCGFINFEKVRYWDGSSLRAFRIKLHQQSLQSDFRKRSDLQMLKQGRIDEAQKAKEQGQARQRKDAKLREKFGPKKQK